LPSTFTGPASPANVIFGGYKGYGPNNASENAAAGSFATALFTRPANTATPTIFSAHISGTIENGINTGTLQLQYANTASSAGSVTVKRGSWCTIPMSSHRENAASVLAASLAALLISASALGQTLTGAGTVTTNGTVEVGPLSSQYVRIFAIFPPENALDQSSHFAPYVMTQGAIDGVTVSVTWSSVETSPPSATPCTPVGSDTCQLDVSGWYHTYSWSSVDNPTLAYWFSSANGWGTKTVNIIGVAQTAPIAPSNVNSATPYYITTPSWIAQAGGAQHYINSINTSPTCSSWSGPVVTSISATPSGDATVTLGSGQVSTANGYPLTANLTANDLVWISGTGTGLDTGATGTAITSVQQGSNTLHYQTSCSSCAVGAVGTAITSVQSWVVPYETPVKTGLKAFIAAAIQHFGPNTSDGTYIKPAQVLYMRFGKSVGGESYVYCSAQLSGTTPPYSVSNWQQYITEMTNLEQSQSPTMLIFEPLNRVNGDDTDYSNYQAKDAIAHCNAYGITYGFGSQGLSLNDKLNNPSCASNWCTLFSVDYYPQGSPLELQQIANSDPFDSTCSSGCIVGTDSGDLRVWLPFAVTEKANVIELYSVDAELAYDPYFCNVVAGACGSGSYASLNGLSAAQQYDYFNDTGPPAGVGIGQACGGNPQGAVAVGNCQYSIAINQAHGSH